MLVKGATGHKRIHELIFLTYLGRVFVAKSSQYVIISAMASQITGIPIVYSVVCSGADHRKHQSSESLASVRRIHRWPVYSPHKRPVTWKLFPCEDNIIYQSVSLHTGTLTRLRLFQCQWNSPQGHVAKTVAILQRPIQYSSSSP